jgi:parvulin-like peptidyl-prolyl isomerase
MMTVVHKSMVKFNNLDIESAEINNYLKQKLKLRQIYQEILAQKIIAETASAKKISVSDAEIETEANKIRAYLRLEKAADTLAWLKDNLLDPDEWEIGIKNDLLRRKLAQHLFDSQTEAYFAQNRLNYDRFILYQLVVPYEKLAQELFYQIEEEEISFYQASHLYDIDSKRRYVCGYEGEVHRWEYHPDITAVIFKTPVIVGELIGPVKSKQGYHLFKIENYLPAQLTSEVRQEIVNELFEEWLNGELNYLIHNEQVPSSI